MPTASARVISAVFLFDTTSEPEAARVASEVYRVLAGDGVLFAAFDPLQVSAALARERGRRPVSAPGVLADILENAGFWRVEDAPLDPGGAGPRVVVAHRR
jgi:hypothetical protein